MAEERNEVDLTDEGAGDHGNDNADDNGNNDDDKAEAAANSWQCQPCRQLLRAQALAAIMFCSAWLLNKRYMMAHVFISDDGPIN